MFSFRAFSQVLIRNLDRSLTRDQVLLYFSTVGKVKDLLLEIDEETSSNSGFALVEYEKNENADKARESFAGRRIGDQFIDVEVLEPDAVGSHLKSVKFLPREEFKTREKAKMFHPEF